MHSTAGLTVVPTPPSASLFENVDDLLRGELLNVGEGGLTILDYTIDNALLYSQGSWSLIHRDLSIVGISEECIDSLIIDGGPCNVLIQAFHVRRELIHYKKLCLHLLTEARRLERELQQCMSYFYIQDENVDQGTWSQLQALLLYSSSYPTKNDDIHNNNNNKKKNDDDDDNDEQMFLQTLVETKRLYLMACRAWMRHKGITRALQDARDIAKFICLSPRHPDKSWERRPTTLKNMPSSMYVTQVCQSSERQNPNYKRGPSRSNTNPTNNTPPNHDNHPIQLSHLQKQNDEQQSSSSSPILNISELIEKLENVSLNEQQQRPGQAALQFILNQVKYKLNWPKEAVNYLYMSIAARGGFKALAMAQELETYCQCLSKLPNRLEKNIQTYQNAQISLCSKIFGTDDPKINLETTTNIRKQHDPKKLKDMLSAAAQTDGQINILEGALEACRENGKWIRILTQKINATQKKTSSSIPAVDSSRNSHDSNTRLFIAGDDVAKFHSCAFVPHDFQLGNILKSSRQILDNFLLPTMYTTITKEDWPPSPNSRRTRVRAFDSTTIVEEKKKNKDKINFKKFQRCQKCTAYFDKIWIRHDLCTICEMKCRDNGQDKKICIFEKCKNRINYFCPHLSRCFVCDAPHSCPDFCRLTRGDGEIVTGLVETLQPKLLLLDFDRTLCSTKSGASPLPANWNKPRNDTSQDFKQEKTNSHFYDCNRRNKDDNAFQHTLDGELKRSILSQQVFGTTHIVTRNSHKAEIQEFLRRQGLSEVANNVLVVPKKVSKGDFIRKTFYDDHICEVKNDVDKICLFIDDDINELVNDTWLRENKQIHRVIFVRAI